MTRPHTQATPGGLLQGMRAWRQQSTRLAAMANTCEMHSDAQSEAWQLVRQAELLARQLRQAAMRGVVGQQGAAQRGAALPDRLQCPRCSAMADKLLQLQCDVIESRTQVLEWHELAAEIDAALQALLACRTTPASCAAELSQIRHRVAAQVDAAPALMPSARGKGRR